MVLVLAILHLLIVCAWIIVKLFQILLKVNIRLVGISSDSLKESRIKELSTSPSSSKYRNYLLLARGTNIGLRSLLVLTNLLLLVLNLLRLIVDLSLAGSVIAFFLFVIAIIGAGAFILLLNDTGGSKSASEGGSPKTELVSSGGQVTGGDSNSAGQGGMSSEAKEWASSFEFFYVGDSIGHGNESSFKSYFKSATFDSVPSRSLEAILGGSGQGGLDVIRTNLDSIKQKGHLVVALGTNDYQLDNSSATVEEVFNIVGPEVKVTWVLSASEGGGSGYGIINREARTQNIKSVLEKYKDQARYLDFAKYVASNGGWSEWTNDSVHLNPSKYDEYSQFHVQGLYDLWGR